jgi:hypothetical protein
MWLFDDLVQRRSWTALQLFSETNVFLLGFDILQLSLRRADYIT